jgi:nucleoside-diphosphate-sugar epimerase
VEVVVGDITDVVLLQNICKNNDCVWHLAALVGPFHSSEACTKVNYEG